MQISWGACQNADHDSLCLGCILRFCVSTDFQVVTDAAGWSTDRTLRMKLKSSGPESGVPRSNMHLNKLWGASDVPKFENVFSR